MSHTTIKHIWPGDRAESAEELRNAWGAAPFIWAAMAERYLPGGKHWLIAASEHDSALWRLDRDPRVPVHQRAVMVMTFDRFYIEKKDFARAAQDIRKVLIDFPNAHVTCHWPAIASIFEEDRDVPAIGFHMTSVTNDLFEPTGSRKFNWKKTGSVYKHVNKYCLTD
jgi:hypothetical protein